MFKKPLTYQLEKENTMIQIDDHPEPHIASQSLICVIGTL